MRQSVAPSRISHAPGSSSQAATAAAAAKLLEKKKEFDAVSALERASSLFLERIEGFAEDCDIMADAGKGNFTACPCFTRMMTSSREVHGQVLEQWPRMFQILSLFCEWFPIHQEFRGNMRSLQWHLGIRGLEIRAVIPSMQTDSASSGSQLRIFKLNPQSGDRVRKSDHLPLRQIVRAHEWRAQIMTLTF